MKWFCWRVVIAIMHCHLDTCRLVLDLLHGAEWAHVCVADFHKRHVIFDVLCATLSEGSM